MVVSVEEKEGELGIHMIEGPDPGRGGNCGRGFHMEVTPGWQRFNLEWRAFPAEGTEGTEAKARRNEQKSKPMKWVSSDISLFKSPIFYIASQTGYN